MNEVILLLSVPLIFGAALLFYRFFGKAGLYCFAAVATVAANIEVLMLIEAFSLEMTLGNILFAATFLVTDILSELEGKAAAKRCVTLSIAVAVFFLLISLTWLCYQPAAGDTVTPALQKVFSRTPRMILAGLSVFAVVQYLDIRLYHRWWRLTEGLCGDRQRFLWLRNNGSTLISQFFNAVLFNVAAFAGTYPAGTLISVIVATYLIYFALTVADTPFLYLAKRLQREKTEDRREVGNQI